jgi:hypothetical protein
VLWSAVRVAAKPASWSAPRSHTPLSVWFWAAYVVASQTLGILAAQFQRQPALTRDETSFGILQTARAWCGRTRTVSVVGRKSMSRSIRLWVGGRMRGEGRGIDVWASKTRFLQARDIGA